MTDVLSTAQRRALDFAVQRGRQVAEAGAADELRRLGVAELSRPTYLTDAENDLRLALREKARQLGDETRTAGADLSLLRGDIAYEQWHRLLFARFLEVNGLLREPTSSVVVTLEDCADLAGHEGEPDGWSVAAKYAAAILPGVFRLSDPSVRVRFSPERRAQLEKVVAGIDREVFLAEDALGWVYQFWQTEEKKRVNASGRKIGGADLAPVTQLFTEDYMVRFLLENSLGAWWAARHPDSPLVGTWEYLRRLDDGTPAAGTFDEWPATAAEVTVMDPCCGSGHFLVAAFGMLWRMRAEEEGLSAVEAQDAVLRDNLFGLELDPRCTQIAMFNVVLEAWKQGGYRRLPTPQIGCSGIPVRATRAEWEALAGEDTELRAAMGRLHSLFRSADSLGSLIETRVDARMADAWIRSAVLVDQTMNAKGEAASVMAATVRDTVRAAALLGSCAYTLVATNVPYLSAGKQSDALAQDLSTRYGSAGADLAIAMWTRWASQSVTSALVLPQTWRFLDSYRMFRRECLDSQQINLAVSLGARAFSTPMWDYSVGLQLATRGIRCGPYIAGDVGRWRDWREKARQLPSAPLAKLPGPEGPDYLVRVSIPGAGISIGEVAGVIYGAKPGQTVRVTRAFWEIAKLGSVWLRLSSSPSGDRPYSGNAEVILRPEAMDRAGVTEYSFTGTTAHGRRGVIFSKMGRLPAALYTGSVFDDNTYVLLPNREADLPALWAFASSGEMADAVREVNEKVAVPTGAVERAIVDIERWRSAAEVASLPEPQSDDPTQWLFKGAIPNATETLQVAVARLLGYRWPDQEPDELDGLADNDGIVALPALLGEVEAVSRLRTLLARAYASSWSSDLERQLVVAAGGKNGVLADWLRDTFFAHHCKVFGNRPFLWHIWDGRKDGFSAIVNYHRLDHATLAKLTFTTLGGWIERQRADAEAAVAGADARVAAALDLQRRLKLILDGAPPYDVYVRWKPTSEQPIGWNPDLDDGVRLNIRPFVTAAVLRSKVNVHWRKDRGTNPDGTERHNDLHPSLDERRAARAAEGVEHA